MTGSNNHAFNGFTPQCLEFFQNLAANNDKTWFEAHRREYEKCLLEPLKALTSELAGFMLSIDHDLVTAPTRAISRIYRDTRFSRNKSPYKTSLWITFKRPVTEWRNTPCWFFEITADSYRYGMGFYNASKETMDRLRETIDRKPAQFREAVAFLGQQELFAPEGEMYRRPLRTDLPEDLHMWYQRKNLYLVCNHLPDQALFTRKVADDMRAGFTILAPLYDYLWHVRKSA